MKKTLSFLNVAILISLISFEMIQCLPANQKQDEEGTQLLTTTRALPSAVPHTTPPAPGCGGYYVAPSGVITSQNYPNNYEDNSDCVWYIKTEAGGTINLKFIDFDVENAENCQYDYLALYTSSDYSSSLLATFCGNSLPASIQSPSNELIVHMRTDAKVTGRGFKASYTNVCPPGFTLYDASSKCYALINTLMDKDAHIAQCSRLAVGAFIAAPLDAGEHLFIKGLIQGQSSSEVAKCATTSPDGSKWTYGYFLGAESCERKTCKNFLWHLSGGLRQKIEYNNFGPGEPNCQGGKEYCLNYKNDFTWNDIDCGFKFCSVCEFRLQWWSR